MNINVLPLVVLNQLYSALIKEQRDIIASDPIAAGALPFLEEVAIKLRTGCVAEGRKLASKRLIAATTEADAAHDRALNLLWAVLQTELSYITFVGGDERRHISIEGIIEVLFPDGLSQTMKSYLQEASQAPILYALLSPGQRAQLETLPWRDTNALEIARRWLAAAEKLGDLVRRRAALEATESQALPTGDRREIRQTAITRLNLFLDLLDQSGLSEAARGALRGPIEAAIVEHEKRLARKGSADESMGQGVDDEAPVSDDVVADDVFSPVAVTSPSAAGSDPGTTVDAINEPWMLSDIPLAESA